MRSFIALGPSQTPSFAYCSPLASLQASPLLGPLETVQVSRTLSLLKSDRFHQLRAPRVPGFTYFVTSFGPLGSAPGFTYFGPPQECQVSPTSGKLLPLASCRLHLFWAPWKRSRFQLLWASSRVPGFTNFRPLSARFHLLWAPRKLQVSPTLGPSQAAGFTSFGPLKSAPGFTYFGLPQESQVSPISGPSQVRSFTYFGPSQAPSSPL